MRRKKSSTADAGDGVEETAAWALAVDDRRPVIAALLHATNAIVDELAPFTPALAARARQRLHTLEKGPPLVPRR